MANATHGFTLQRKDEGIPLYPSLDPKGAPQPGLWWTREPEQALSFSRTIDAQRFMENYASAIAPMCQIHPITQGGGA